MKEYLQKNPQIKILHAVSEHGALRLRERDIDEVTKTVQGALPQSIDEDIEFAITVVEKNLRIMGDMVLMKEALTRLVRDAVFGCRNTPLSINRVNFEIESLLNSDDTIIGAFAFIPHAVIDTYLCVDKKITEKILEPFFTIKTAAKGLALAMAYRVTKAVFMQNKRREPSETHGEEVNIYLPLTKLEMVNMMSIPAM